jgi:hypothetical protein
VTGVTGSTRRPPPLIRTASGEVEHEHRSRRANALEALAATLLLLLAFRTGIGLPPDAGEPSWARAAGLGLAMLVGAYTLFAAPWVHGDGWHGLGLAAPFELRSEWTRRGVAFRAAAAVLVTAVPALLAWAGWGAMLVRLGIRQTWPDMYGRMISPPWSVLGMTLTAVVIGPALAVFLIRWNNLATATRAAGRPFGALLAVVAAAAAVSAAGSGDWTRFSEFTWMDGSRAFLPRLAAYLPWGLLQQWFFLAYLNTRVRKAVPETGWGGMPGRVVSAALTGLAFCAIHWPNAPLMALTFAGGCVSGWLFQQDRSRNLFLLGLAHAFAGALVTTLTAVRMGVGARL